ncbi:hypothetical protein E0L36_15360 [Streptomyces sp. AJS327]|uniref:hypothetical protein n=1 Tax=Streptomyces sp. AJS327 TaxID=2545265 RepID=UPI0015DFD59A|nr:hypothetical protein [Streptomyces sp. AJS327]MBA0052231.1 hypothetical protein [Streptomyces sp. AJS327]
MRCCAELAERESASPRVPVQRRCLERLDAETVNLRRALALDLAAEKGAEHAVRLVYADSGCGPRRSRR